MALPQQTLRSVLSLSRLEAHPDDTEYLDLTPWTTAGRRQGPPSGARELPYSRKRNGGGRTFDLQAVLRGVTEIERGGSGHVTPRRP
jgi:hypothetical protein